MLAKEPRRCRAEHDVAAQHADEEHNFARQEQPDRDLPGRGWIAVALHRIGCVFLGDISMICNRIGHDSLLASCHGLLARDSVLFAKGKINLNRLTISDRHTLLLRTVQFMPRHQRVSPRGNTVNLELACLAGDSEEWVLENSDPPR